MAAVRSEKERAAEMAALAENTIPSQTAPSHMASAARPEEGEGTKNDETPEWLPSDRRRSVRQRWQRWLRIRSRHKLHPRIWPLQQGRKRVKARKMTRHLNGCRPIGEGACGRDGSAG